MKKRIKEMLEDVKEVVEIGEDGGMVVDGTLSFEEAYKKMKQFHVDCNGQEAADEFFRDWCKPDMVGTAWLHLTTKKQKSEWEDSEWYVSTKERSEYPVWYYSG